jgi:hypothetical protein
MEGASRKVLLRKSSNAVHPDTVHEAKEEVAEHKKKEQAKVATKASKEDEQFLNNFLDTYDAKKKETASVSAAPAPPTLQQRVQKAFPETQQVKPSGNVDDVISDFLANYDSKPQA